ncbi:MAG TPA: PAS domain S-box protein, partial [Reyranella sp.]
MIYNDAYAVFAGGRHPQLLGSKVREGWPEVADFNDNIMRVVMAGKTLSYREQELTLYRHGVAEKLWTDLDYSPILDEDGRPVAVIAIVIETTDRVMAQRSIAGEWQRMAQMFEQAPGFMAMLSGPNHVFELTNRAYMQLIGHREVIGKTVREALPEIEGQGFYELLDTVFATGEAFIGNSLKVSLQRIAGGESEERFVDLIYQPVRDPEGQVTGIFVEGADVTERVVAERVVRESEAQFRLFAEAMPNHVWTSRTDGMLDWFNSRVYEYSGTKPGELDGQKWGAIVHPDDIWGAAAVWAERLASGEPYETEFRLRRADGVYRWHIARAVPIRDADGIITRWIGTNTDIDDQKQTQQALIESDARLKLAIEAGQLAIWELDMTAGRVAPSVALNRLYGFADDAEPTAADYQSRYAPGEAERLAQLGAEAAARGDTDLEVELRHIFPDGAEKWFLIRAEAVDGGKRAIGVVIDVTERKRVQAELIESERRFRLSQNAAGIASLELDIPTGKVVGSDGFWGLWGLSPRDSIHISELEAIVLPEDGQVRSTATTRRTGTAAPDVEYRIRRADTGELRWLSRNIEFTYDAAGKPLKMFGIMQDITDRREAQSRQEILTHELEHRIKNILAMVAAISSQTLKNTDLDTARESFNERLRALAGAHDILTKTRWTDASLAEVVRSAMAPYRAEKIFISGAFIAISPKMALSLALAVNELATNSLKYGALSTEQGQVHIDWSIAPGADDQLPELTWRWTERNGPTVSPPSRRGFGSFLIQRVLAADFAGIVRIDYPPEGVECILVAPVAGRAASA